MSGRRFGSWPVFNGKKVVLEDDARLSAGVPTSIPAGGSWRLQAGTQAVAAVSIIVDGTAILDGTLVML